MIYAYKSCVGLFCKKSWNGEKIKAHVCIIVLLLEIFFSQLFKVDGDDAMTDHLDSIYSTFSTLFGKKDGVK